MTNPTLETEEDHSPQTICLHQLIPTGGENHEMTIQKKKKNSNSELCDFQIQPMGD